MYEGFLTNEIVATYLWCPFRVKSYSFYFRVHLFRPVTQPAMSSNEQRVSQKHPFSLKASVIMGYICHPLHMLLFLGQGL
jgi:hypothetical protein